MITTTERASNLSDLISGEFLIVAERRADEIHWIYSLPQGDVVAFQTMVGHGDAVSVQRREPGGAFVVLAKLAVR